MSVFDTGYRTIGEAPPGDAMSAQRAVGTDGTEAIVKTVKPLAPGSFLAEVPRLAAVIDPHLERVITWEGRGEVVLLATEPVPGDPFTALTTAPVAEPAAQVSSLGIDAALGLAALHDQGIVHGGIKPSTLIRDPRGGVVVVDACLAQAAGGADLTESSPPQAAAYVSPEEAMGRPLVPASDVYALGVVLYRLATGRLPFDGGNAEEVAQAHVGAPLMAPRQIQPDIPVALESVIVRCLEKDPQNRYANGRELVRALEGELAPTRVMAPPVAAPPPARRRRVWPWVVGVVVAAAVVLLALWAAGVFTSKVAVPNVVDMSLSKATTTLDNAGFKTGAVSYQQATGKAQGTVLSQSPAAAATAKKGSAVDLVAVGTSLQVVPNVVGMTQSAASSALAQAGLQLGSVTKVYSATAPSGVVTGQAPAEGLKVESGSPVAVTVSKGPKPAASPAPVAVPDVTNKAKADAVSALTSAGFTVVIDNVSSSTVPSGTVIDQTPSAGVLAEPGSTVTIVVSTGPPAPAPSASP